MLHCILSGVRTLKTVGNVEEGDLRVEKNTKFVKAFSSEKVSTNRCVKAPYLQCSKMSLNFLLQHCKHY